MEVVAALLAAGANKEAKDKLVLPLPAHVHTHAHWAMYLTEHLGT